MDYGAFNQLSTHESPILDAHCLVPQRHKPAFHCSRHHRDLSRMIRSHRIVSIVTPPGYGKTSLASQYAISYGMGNSWLTTDTYHNDPSLLVSGLQAAFRTRFPELPGLSGGQSHGATLTRLLNALTTIGRAPFLVVLDNLHALTEPEACDIVERFIEYTPENIKVLMLSRSQPTLSNLPRLRASGDVGSLQASDLSLTPEEVTGFLAHHSRGPWSNNFLERVSELEGWVTGLLLMISAHEKSSALSGYGKHEDHPATDLASANQHIADYLMCEAFSKLPHDLQRFMLHSSVLEELEAGACEAVGIYDAHRNLQKLRSGAYYVASDNMGGLRYRAFFRHFLRGRLALEEQATIGDLHRKATHHYLSRQLYTQAIEHHISSGEYAQGADLIGKLHEVIMADAYSPLFAQWLNRFPKELRSTHPWLLLSQARAELGEIGMADTEQLYKRAEQGARETADRTAIFLALCSFAQWLRARGRHSEALIAYEEAQIFCEDDQERAVVIAAIALCSYLEQGSADEALNSMSMAVDLARTGDRTTTLIAVLQLHAELLFLLGDLHGALAGFRAVLKLEERGKERPGERTRELTTGELTRQESISMAVRWCAYLHALRGEWQQATDLINSAPKETADPHSIRASRAVAAAQVEHVRGMIAQGTRRHAHAWAHYNRALDLYERAEDRWHMATVLACMSALACEQGDADQALKYAEKGWTLRSRVGSLYEQAQCRLALGKALAISERWHDAQRNWALALEIFTTCGARHQQAQLHFYLAWLRSKDPAVAAVAAIPTEDPLPGSLIEDPGILPHLRVALQLCRENDYSYLLTSDPALTVPLLAYSIESGVQPVYAAEVLRRIGARGTPDALVALQSVKNGIPGMLAGGGPAASPSPNLKHAAQMAISAWLDAEPEPLHVRTLGVFSLQRGERPVQNWPRLSSKIIFQYLLLHRSRPVPVDELIDLLWPDSEAASARKNLHQVVTGLRHVLEPELPAGVSSRYLRVAAGTYQLALPAGSTVDDELFLDLCKRADTLQDREKATALYTDEYLADNPYSEWTMAHRERLSHCYRALMLRLSSDYLDAGKLDECISTARYLCEQEPWSENAAHLLMSAYAARGERAAALRTYNSLQKCLQQELHISPRPEITSFYMQILRQS